MRTTPLMSLIMAFSFSAAVLGQGYPDRPVRLIVAYPPGGGTDVTARTIVGKLSEGLGRQVGSSPDQFAKFVAGEIAKWKKVVRDAGIKAEF